MTKWTVAQRKTMAREGKELRTLVNDSNYSVRMIVARYKQFHNVLKDDKSSLVRREVAKYGNEETANYLLNDTDEAVRKICYNQINLNNIPKLINESEKMKCEVVKNKSLIYWPFLIDKGSSFVDKMVEFVANNDTEGENQLINLLSR